MVTKEKIQNLITTTRELRGNITLSFVPSSVLNDVEELYNLYYGGQNKIEIGKYYTNFSGKLCSDGGFIDVSSNISDIVDDVYNCLNDSIGDEIIQALEELEWEAEELKYFDRKESDEKYKIFKKKVLELKEKNNG